MLIMAALGEAVEVGDIMETCTEKRLVVDELLSFVAYKLNWMAPDTIIQLCSSFYSEEAVDNAKTHLYELCADRADRQNRCIKRSGANKKKTTWRTSFPSWCGKMARCL